MSRFIEKHELSDNDINVVSIDNSSIG